MIFTQFQKCIGTVLMATPLSLLPAVNASAGSTSVPFIAVFSGSAQFTSATTAEFVGSGHATYLGMLLNIGSIVITGPPDETGCLPNTNTEYLTAANGDLLVLEMSDKACPIDNSGLRFEGTGNWKVISGTGRFENVTGTGTVVGFGNFLDGIFGTTITGQLEGLGVK